MAPKSARGESGNVRLRMKRARIPRDPCLPGRHSVMSTDAARAAYHATVGASADGAAFARSRVGTSKDCVDAACATVVPCRLRNVAQGISVMGGVRCTPVGALGRASFSRVVIIREVCAACNCHSRSSKSAHVDSGRGRAAGVLVGDIGTGVARGDEDRLALEGGLCIQRVLRSVIR